MKKDLVLVSYDSNWPNIFEKEAVIIQTALMDNFVAIHHIGSTSVPGLCAKPKIDIIAVVKNGETSINQLEGAGFIYKGEWNIPFKFGFTKRGEHKVNLHVFEQGQPEIEANILFRDYLINNLDAKTAYADLKESLLLDESSYARSSIGLPYYTLRKGDFIRGVLKKAGFNRIRILKCSDDTQWRAAQNFRNMYFDRKGMKDLYEWTFHHEDHEHLILYQGVDIVGYTHVEFLQGKGFVNMLVIDERGQELKSEFLMMIEKWLVNK